MLHMLGVPGRAFAAAAMTSGGGVVQVSRAASLAVRRASMAASARGTPGCVLHWGSQCSGQCLCALQLSTVTGGGD